MRAFVAALALALWLPQSLAQPAVPPQLEQLPERFVELFRQGNVEGIVALFASDASYIPIAGPARLDGHPGVRAYYQKVFQGSRSRNITVLDHRWQLLGDVVIRSADVVIDQELAGGQAIDTRARITFVFRQEAGIWKIHHHHGSQQPGAPKPAEPSFGQCGRS